MIKETPITFAEILGERLESAMTLRKKSKAELSELTKISAQTLTNISSGKNETSFVNISKIAKALELSLDYFASSTHQERDVYTKNDSDLNSTITSIANKIRLSSAENKQTLFQYVLPKIILELEDELNTKFKLIDWRKE